MPPPNKKFSQITSAIAPPVSADRLIGVSATNVDLLYSINQVAAAIGGAPVSGISLAITRLQIPSNNLTGFTRFYTSDGAPWVRTSDNTQPTYTQDSVGNGWIIDQTVSVAKLAWFKNMSTMATADWDPVGLTGTDNSVAMLEMQAFGQKVCATGRRFVLDGTANHANNCWAFKINNCFYAVMNLTKFTLEGNGSQWQNIDGVGQSASLWSPWFQSAAPNSNVAAGPSGFINAYFPVLTTVTPGATSVTLVTAGQTGSFLVNDWIAIASLSVQYSGFPHNWDQCEYVQITGIPGGGVINFTPPLRYEHRTDFPDDTNLGQFPGAVKVVQMNNPIGALNHPAGYSPTVSWDVDHLFRNMHVLNPANTSGTVTYQINGRKIRLEKCIFDVGNSESQCGEFSTEDCYFNGSPEPDKNVGVVYHLRSHWSAGLGFQSGSFGSITFDDCTVTGGSGLILAGRHVRVRGGSFSNLSAATNNIGLSRNISIDTVEAVAFNQPILFPGAQFAVDGSNIQYASGTFKCTKTMSGLATILRARPGAQLAWQVSAKTSMYPGDLGLMTVSKIRQDASFVYFDTDCQSAAVPAWSNGNVYLMGVQSVNIENSNGCDSIRRASEGTLRGKRTDEFFKFTYFGQETSSTTFSYLVNGIVKSFNVNVRRTTSVIASPVVAINIDTTMASAPGTPSGPDVFRITIDLTQAGLRVINTTSATLFGTDSLTWNGTPAGLTAFPANALMASGISPGFNFNSSLYTVSQLPVVDIEVETDLGMLGALTTQFDSFGSTVAGVVGRLPS